MVGPKEVRELYYGHRDPFFNFGKKYGLDYDDIADIYQEAFIALREHAINGKLDDLKSSVKTYLFGIGKFKIYDRLKELNQNSSVNLANTIDNIVKIAPFDLEKSEPTREQKLLRKHFKTLGKKCQEVLTLFYSRGLTIDEIVEFTTYRSSSVVRSQKSRCIKTLKKLIQEG